MDRFLFFPLAARFVLLVIMLIPLLISGLTLAVYQNDVPQEERAPFWTTALSGLAVTNMVMVVYTIFPFGGSLPILLIPIVGSFVTVLFAKREPLATHWLATHWVRVLMSVIAGSVVGWVAAFIAGYAFTMSLFIR